METMDEDGKNRSAEYQRGMLGLLVREILLKYSDSDAESPRVLTQREIMELLEADYGVRVGPKALRRTLNALAEFDPNVSCKADVKRRRRSRGEAPEKEESLKTDYSISHLFSEGELAFLMDAAAFAPNVPASFRKDMTEKLRSLASAYFDASDAREDAPSWGNPELFLTVETLREAIRSGRKVTLQYLDRDLDGNAYARRDDAGKPVVHTVSPYELVMHSGRYYVICNNDAFDTLAHYRVDRLHDVRLTERKARPLSTVSRENWKLREKIHDYRDEHALMFPGPVVEARLRVDRGRVKHVWETFGASASLGERDGEIIAVVRSDELSVLHFVLGFPGSVFLLSPAYLRERMRVALEKALEGHRD